MIISGILITARRFVELFLLNSGLSAIITIFSISGALDTENKLLTALAVGVVVFMSINTVMLRHCFFDLENRNFYYITNVIAYFLFVLANLAVYYFCSEEVYTWIFAITKIAHFSVLDVSNLYSALAFHCIGMIVTMIAPLGMSWIFTDNMYGDSE